MFKNDEKGKRFMSGSRSMKDKVVMGSDEPKFENEGIKQEGDKSPITAVPYANSDDENTSDEDLASGEKKEPENGPVVKIDFPNSQNGQGAMAAEQQPNAALQNPQVIEAPAEQTNPEIQKDDDLESGIINRRRSGMASPDQLEKDAERATAEHEQKIFYTTSCLSRVVDHAKGFGIGFLISGSAIGINYLTKLIPGVSAYFSPSLADFFNTTVAAGVARKEGGMWNNEYTPFDKVIGIVIHVGTSLVVSEGFRYAVTIVGGDPDAPEITPAKMAAQGMLDPLAAEVVDKSYSYLKLAGLFGLTKCREIANRLSHSISSEEPEYAQLPSGPSKP
jgi:hypothetical protein